MPVKLRLALFYFFVALFFVSLPIFSLYSLGYRMNFATHRLERLGMISIRTIPDEASIVLAGHLLKQKTPAKLANLFPGNYSLTLAKTGFRPWKGEITVKPNWVTQLESVILFPEPVEFHPVTDLVPSRFFLAPKARKMIVLGASGDDRGLWLLDLFLEEETLILDERALAERALRPTFLSEDLEVRWAKDERAVLIRKENNFFLLDLKKPNRIANLKDLLGLEPEEAAWSEKSADTFYYLARGVVSKYSFRKKKKEELLLEEVSHFHYQNGFLYYIAKPAGVLWRLSEDFLEKVPIVEIPEFDPRARYEMIINPEGDLLSRKLQVDVLKNKSVFYELNTSRKFEGIREALWDKSGKHLLLIGKGEGLLLSRPAAKNGNGAKPQRVQVPGGVRKIFWFDANKLIFLFDREASLGQVGSESESYTQEIFSFPAGWASAVWDSRLKQLYCIEPRPGEEAGRLVRINLAQGPLSKLIENMRETMSDGIQLLQEAGKNDNPIRTR